jgi:plasmid maintenance system antidote protein VapI
MLSSVAYLCNRKEVTGQSSLRDRFLIASCGLRDAELATKLGIARSTVWRARTGRTKLSGRARSRLISLFDESGEVADQAHAVETLLELAINRQEVRELLTSLNMALSHEYATKS